LGVIGASKAQIQTGNSERIMGKNPWKFNEFKVILTEFKANPG